MRSSARAAPSGDQTRNELVDLGFGADIHPTRRLIENENLRAGEQPAPEQ